MINFIKWGYKVDWLGAAIITLVVAMSLVSLLTLSYDHVNFRQDLASVFGLLAGWNFTHLHYKEKQENK